MFVNELFEPDLGLCSVATLFIVSGDFMQLFSKYSSFLSCSKTCSIHRLSLSQRKSESGVALILVLLLTSIMLMFISMGLTMAKNSLKDSSQSFAKGAQASNIARAGLQDAIGWFKRQTNQPVRKNDGVPDSFGCGDEAFQPLFNADPLISDTDNQTTGLVKDIRLSDKLYGRYEIKRNNCSSPSKNAVKDFSNEKGKGADGDGIIWYVESKGTLYYRDDFTKTNGVFVKGPTDAPNRVLQKSTVGVEIQRLKIAVPLYPVAVTAASGSVGSTVGDRCNIMSDTNAIGGIYRFNTTVAGSPECSLPTTAAMAQCVQTSTGTSSHQSVDAVFGVTQVELKALADYIYATVANVPKQLPLAIHYLEGGGTGTFTFNSSKPLTGSGILFVNGNLDLPDGASAAFNGVIYVTGTLTVGNGNTLGGAVVARSLTCNPGSGIAIIEYNHNVVKSIRQKLGLYRENTLTYRISN